MPPASPRFKSLEEPPCLQVPVTQSLEKHSFPLFNCSPQLSLPLLPLPLQSPAELPPWSCLACWEGKHSLLCTLYNRHPAPTGIPDQAWTPEMTNRSSGRGSGVLPYPGSIVGSFFVMWNPTHMVIVANKECHLFLGSESGGQKGLYGKDLCLATFPNSAVTPPPE